MPGSAAIDNGVNSAGLVLDQRGFNRVSGSGIDIGAVEVVPEPNCLGLMCAALLAISARRKRESL